jgi:hypothetical protein
MIFNAIFFKISLEILLLKKQIVNQIQHVFKKLPESNMNVGFQFMTDKNLFEKAVYEYFGYFFNDKEQQQNNKLTSSSQVIQILI